MVMLVFWGGYIMGWKLLLPSEHMFHGIGKKGGKYEKPYQAYVGSFWILEIIVDVLRNDKLKILFLKENERQILGANHCAIFAVIWMVSSLDAFGGFHYRFYAFVTAVMSCYESKQIMTLGTASKRISNTNKRREIKSWVMHNWSRVHVSLLLCL